MADTIEVMIEDDRWDAFDLVGLAQQAFELVFKDQSVDPAYEVSVLACNDAKIAELNADFRDKPTATNVLSWPAFELAPEQDGGAPNAPPKPEPPFFDAALGDIALSYDTCAREAAEGNIPFTHHLSHLLIHSCLHLLGHDHETDADAARMQRIETKLLASMGITDPY